MNGPVWVRVAARILVCVTVTVIMWWFGARFLGVAFQPEGYGAAFSSAIWVVLIAMVWAYVLGVPAMAWIVGRFVGGMYDSADSQFRVRPEFSIAEGHAAAGRFREAVAQFRCDIEQHPAEVTPHVRIAEIVIERFGEVEAGIAELETALRKATGEDAFVLVAHRLADAYVQHRGDKGAAIECLDQILQRFPHSKHALGARHRIQTLTGN